jgi:hypothetical protein
MLKWNPSILSKWETPGQCWWCGSADLSREHKYKKTDFELLYGKSEFPKGQQMAIIRYAETNKPIIIQSSSSTHLKFEAALCTRCNNARSSKMDKAYTSVMKHYLQNEDLINNEGFIDFKSIFQDEWQRSKMDFYGYCVKHICSRLVEAGLSPSANLVGFLNGAENLRDVKFVLQIKNYFFGQGNNQIDSLYLGPFNIFEQDHLFIGRKMTAVASWYTFKQLSINYLFKKYLLDDTDIITKDSKLNIHRIDYRAMAGDNFNIDQENAFRGWGELKEMFEYYPFVGENKKIDHYNYLLEY